LSLRTDCVVRLRRSFSY